MKPSKETIQMSHTVKIATEVLDAHAVCLACQRLSLPTPVEGKARLFAEDVLGLAVQLPEWQYPVVFDTNTGQVRYDNYGGRWGDKARLDRFLQAYAVEKAKIEARRKGYSVIEQELANGSIKLTVQVGGEA
jgi:hypothetical protein